MGINAQRAARWLKDSGFMETDDPQTSFEVSINNLMNEFLKRVPVAGQYKGEILRMRAELAAKRRRGPHGTGPVGGSKKKDRRGRTDAEATAEVRREPLKVVTCNLNDHTTTDGVELMIDDFVGRASQGNVTVRQDLERMIAHMRRTDLPPTQRRGFVAIRGTRVRFGETLWDFSEFKPSEAAGLSLRTDAAKTSRIHFIRPDDETIGIIAIKPRSEQDDFLREIRARIKLRGRDR